MVSAGVTSLLIHSLLNDDPFSAPGEEEAVMIKLVPVLEGVGINLGRHAAGIDEVGGLGVEMGCARLDFERGLPGGSPLSSGHKETQFLLQAL
jgi:hypothetical protein